MLRITIAGKLHILSSDEVERIVSYALSVAEVWQGDPENQAGLSDEVSDLCNLFASLGFLAS